MSNETKLSEAIEIVEIWVDMWSDEQAEVEEPDGCDIEERKVIEAVRTLIKASKGLHRLHTQQQPVCPHAAPHVYCDGCKVSPCPVGLD